MKTHTALLILIIAVIGLFLFTKNPDIQVQSEQVIPQGWTVYKNNSLGFSIQYPDDWIVDEYALDPNVSLDPSVSITPPDPEPMLGYITVSLESRNLAAVHDVYMGETYNGENIFVEETGEIAGHHTVEYAYKKDGRDERTIYLLNEGKVYSIGTDKYTLPEVRQAIESFKLI